MDYGVHWSPNEDRAVTAAGRTGRDDVQLSAGLTHRFRTAPPSPTPPDRTTNHRGQRMHSGRATNPLPAWAPPPAPVTTPGAADGGARPAAWRGRAVAALRLTLAALFVAAGSAKLLGAPEMVALFGTIENVTGAGAWLRLTTGSLEVLGGVLLGARAAAGVGAVLLGTVMAAAALTHVLVLRDAPTAPAVLLAALAVVAYAHRATLRAVGAVLVQNL